MNRLDLIINALENAIAPATIPELVGIKKALAAARELQLELTKQEFYPDWDMIKPYHDRIAELEAQLAEQEQEKPEWQELYKDEIKEILNDGEEWAGIEFAQAVSDALREKNR
jgi:hypothetical protein